MDANAVTRDLGGKSELTTIHKERRKASAVSANRILRHLSAPLGTIHGTRGAITTKKPIPNSVKTARNVPVNVSRSTTTVVLRSPSILFLALLSAMKKTIHKRIVTIMRVIEK